MQKQTGGLQIFLVSVSMQTRPTFRSQLTRTFLQRVPINVLSTCTGTLCSTCETLSCVLRRFQWNTFSHYFDKVERWVTSDREVVSYTHLSQHVAVCTKSLWVLNVSESLLENSSAQETRKGLNLDVSELQNCGPVTTVMTKMWGEVHHKLSEQTEFVRIKKCWGCLDSLSSEEFSRYLRPFSPTGKMHGHVMKQHHSDLFETQRIQKIVSQRL